MDMWTLCGNTVVAIEIDEDEHKHYVEGYEVVRYQDLLMDFTGRFVFLRIYPDGFRKAGRQMNPPFEQRATEAIHRLREILRLVKLWGSSYGPDDADAPLIEIHHMFYSE